MRTEDKKYMWWGLLGIGVAALFYFLSSKNQSKNANTVTVPYLVPQYKPTTGASPTADTSLSTQPNIVGSSSNSTVPNFTNPAGVATSVGEAPNTWGFWPNLNVSPVQGNYGSVFSGTFPYFPHNGSTSTYVPVGIPQSPSPAHI